MNIATLFQYLLEGDFIGFFQAIYVSSFQSVDLLFGMLMLLFTMPLYIRTKSLALLCVLWTMLGGFFTLAFPMVGVIASLFWIMGVGGLLWKAYTSMRS